MPFTGLSMTAEQVAIAQKVFDEISAEGWDGSPDRLAAIIFNVFREGHYTQEALKAETKRKIANPDG